jgi:hypothetical protein
LSKTYTIVVEEIKKMYSCYENERGRFVITGPCIAVGDLVLNTKVEATVHVRFLNEAFKAGRRAKMAEIKQALEFSLNSKN